MSINVPDMSKYSADTIDDWAEARYMPLLTPSRCLLVGLLLSATYLLGGISSLVGLKAVDRWLEDVLIQSARWAGAVHIAAVHEARRAAADESEGTP